MPCLRTATPPPSGQRQGCRMPLQPRLDTAARHLLAPDVNRVALYGEVDGSGIVEAIRPRPRRAVLAQQQQTPRPIGYRKAVPFSIDGHLAVQQDLAPAVALDGLR